jgi:hypothetical protein
VSQVIIIEDKLSERRSSSREQEQKIDINTVHRGWHKNDIAPRALMVRKIAFVIFLPIFLFWSLLVLAITVAVFFFTSILKLLGAMVPVRHKTDVLK